MSKPSEYLKWKMKRGWYNVRKGANPKYESYRHTLARFGIKTKGLTQEELKQKLDTIKKKKKFSTKRPEDEGKITWKSIYDAPVDKIVKEFKEAYGREPTELELNDILLGGEW